MSDVGACGSLGVVASGCQSSCFTPRHLTCLLQLPHLGPRLPPPFPSLCPLLSLIDPTLLLNSTRSICPFPSPCSETTTTTMPSPCTISPNHCPKEHHSLTRYRWQQLPARPDIPGGICTGSSEARIRRGGIGEQDTCRAGRTQGSPSTSISIRDSNSQGLKAPRNDHSATQKNSPPTRRRSSRSTRTWASPSQAWPPTPASSPTS